MTVLLFDVSNVSPAAVGAWARDYKSSSGGRRRVALTWRQDLNADFVTSSRIIGNRFDHRLPVAFRQSVRPGVNEIRESRRPYALAMIYGIAGGIKTGDYGAFFATA